MPSDCPSHSSLHRLLYTSHISPAQLKLLLAYVYRGEDRSLTYKYVLSPIYSRLIHFVPLSIHPNAITFIGFLMVLASHLLLIINSPRLIPPDSPFLFIFASLSLLAYMVLDNLDGKQARRTNSSSPLGHLFDHGCDSINVTMSGISLLVATNLAPTFKAVSLLFGLGQLCAFSANLEEYFTGAMVLQELNGPNEGILTLAAFLFISAAKGPSWWNNSLPIPLTAHEIQLNHIAYYFAIGPVLHSTLANAISIVKHIQRTKNKSFVEAISIITLHSMSIVLFGATMMSWPLFAPVSFSEHPLVVLWISCLVLFDLISRMILATLSGARFPYMPWLFAPMVGAFVNAVAWEKGWGGVDPHSVLWVVLLGVFVYSGWRIWCLVTQLCEVLNVKCFRLGKLRQEK